METSSEIPRIGQIDSSYIQDKTKPTIPPRYHPIRSISVIQNNHPSELYKRQLSMGTYLHPQQPVSTGVDSSGMGGFHLLEGYPSSFGFDNFNPRKAPNMNFREKINHWLENIELDEYTSFDCSFSSEEEDDDDVVEIDIDDFQDRLQFQAEKLTRLTRKQYRFDPEPVAICEEYKEYEDTYQVLIHPNY